MVGRLIEKSACVPNLDKSRSITNKVFSRVWNSLEYPIFFSFPIVLMWPDPILKDFWDWAIYYMGGIGKGNTDIYSNIATATLFFAIEVLVWVFVRSIFRFENPKRDLVGKIMIIASLIGGIAAGAAWANSVSTTHYQDRVKKEYPYVNVNHWRPEIRAFTGMDFILGIDLTIPKVNRFDEERKAKLEAIHALVMKGYHAKAPAERQAIRAQASKERLAFEDERERLYGRPWKQWHKAMYADPANDCRHKLFCTTNDNEFKIAAEREWDASKGQRDIARDHNIVFFEK